jgi:hypothetical protein
MKNKILLLFLLCCSFPTLAQEEGEGEIVKIGEKLQISPSQLMENQLNYPI